MEQNHTRWVRTVQSSPDVIEMTFVPITDLLVGAPGKEHLTRAIDLYLECKTSRSLLESFPSMCCIANNRVFFLTVTSKLVHNSTQTSLRLKS